MYQVMDEWNRSFQPAQTQAAEMVKNLNEQSAGLEGFQSPKLSGQWSNRTADMVEHMRTNLTELEELAASMAEVLDLLNEIGGQYV